MSGKPLYHWIPKWVLLLVDEKKCSRCSVKQKKEGITCVGVRKVKEDWCFVIEHVCNQCEFREMLGFNEGSDLEDFCHMMLQEIMDKKSIERSNARQRGVSTGSITDKEVNDFLKFMDSSEDYDSVLKHIGYNENPIERQTRIESENLKAKVAKAKVAKAAKGTKAKVAKSTKISKATKSSTKTKPKTKTKTKSTQESKIVRKRKEDKNES